MWSFGVFLRSQSKQAVAQAVDLRWFEMPWLSRETFSNECAHWCMTASRWNVNAATGLTNVYCDMEADNNLNPYTTINL